jgi:hypothetical protein
VQAPQLQATTKKHGACQQPTNLGDWQMASEGASKNPTNTIEFISQHKVPADCRKDVTYGQFVCSVRPEKAEPNQMRFTVGGDRINYPG